MDQVVLWRDVLGGGRNRLRCAASTLALRLLLNVDRITATTESMTHIAEARFEERVKTGKNCVILEGGFWDMVIPLPYKASERRSRLSVAFGNSDDM